MPTKGYNEELSLWKNPDTHFFHCITFKKDTFHSQDAYKYYLLGLLKAHFFNKIKLFSNEYFLRVAEDEFSDLLDMDPKEFLLSRDYVTVAERDLLDLTTTDLQSADDDLKFSIAECLAEAWEESYLVRQKKHQDAILKEQEKQDQYKINIKDTQEQLNQTKKSIQTKEAEIDKYRIELDNTKHLISDAEEKINHLSLKEKQAHQKLKEKFEKERQALKDLEQKNLEKKEELAWASFKITLEDATPTFDLVSKGKSLPIFELKAADLLKYICKNFNITTSSDLQNYVYKHTKTTEIEMKKILESFIQEPSISDYGTCRQISGKAILLSHIKTKFDHKMEEVHLNASKIIYIDCDVVYKGASVALSAPLIKALMGTRQICTTGSNAQGFSNSKACNGNRSGVSGDHGQNGQAGESAGHVRIQCRELCGFVNISANGGNGADGQDGGDGANGENGYNGQDGHISKPDYSWWKFENTCRTFSGGTPGKAGQTGGNGGRNGLGGAGGQPGNIQLDIEKGKNNCCINSNPGQQGKDGNYGNGGIGGKGGRNGIDRGYAHENRLGAEYQFGEGNIEFHRCTSWQGDGYTIVVKSSNKGYATDGQHGAKGSKSNENQRNTSREKKQISKVNFAWSDTGKCTQSKNEQLNQEFEQHKNALKGQFKREADVLKTELGDIGRHKKGIQKDLETNHENFANIIQRIQQTNEQKSRKEDVLKQQKSTILLNQKKSDKSMSLQKRNEKSLQYLQAMDNFKDKVFSTITTKTVQKIERIGDFQEDPSINIKVSDWISVDDQSLTPMTGSMSLLDTIIMKETDVSISQELSLLAQTFDIKVTDSEYRSFVLRNIGKKQNDPNSLLLFLQLVMENYILIKKYDATQQIIDLLTMKFHMTNEVQLFQFLFQPLSVSP